jgi:hypothetical protein
MSLRDPAEMTRGELVFELRERGAVGFVGDLIKITAQEDDFASLAALRAVVHVERGPRGHELVSRTRVTVHSCD